MSDTTPYPVTSTSSLPMTRAREAPVRAAIEPQAVGGMPDVLGHFGQCGPAEPATCHEKGKFPGSAGTFQFGRRGAQGQSRRVELEKCGRWYDRSQCARPPPHFQRSLAREHDACGLGPGEVVWPFEQHGGLKGRLGPEHLTTRRNKGAP